jgi:hypothetical protein
MYEDLPPDHPWSPKRMAERNRKALILFLIMVGALGLFTCVTIGCGIAFLALSGARPSP